MSTVPSLFGLSQQEEPVVSGNAIFSKRLSRLPIRRRVEPPPLPALPPHPALLNWTAIAGAAGSAVLLVGIVLIWVATHPTRRGTEKSTRVEPVAVASIAAPVEPVALPEAKPEPTPVPVEEQPVKPLKPGFASVVLPPLVEKPLAVAPVIKERPAPKAPVAAVDAPATCDTLGTSVEFDANPARASQRAAKEGKLLMILHVSGNFEDSAFT